MIKTIKKKIVTQVTNKLFTPKIRTRHPSHSPLRSRLEMLPFPSVIRLGSTTTVPDLKLQSGKIIKRIELNSPDAIRNSASKFLMKECFKQANVKTAEFYKVKEVKDNIAIWEIFPLVAKINFGSRGRGMFKLDNIEQLKDFLKKPDLSGYYFEKFYNYVREYRLHVNNQGCFYTCRKMVKSDTPEDKKWFRNDSNSIWVMENNPDFDRPANWTAIVEECVKALKSVGLDFGAVDLRVQSSKDGKGKVREQLDFIVIEINSAPSFGDVTLQKYLEEIPNILKRKYALLNKI